MLSILSHPNANFHIRKSITKFPVKKETDTCKTLPPQIIHKQKQELEAMANKSPILENAENCSNAPLPANHVLCRQSEILESDRSLIVNWMLMKLGKWKTDGMAFFLAVNVLDRYLALKVVPLEKLPLLAMGCILIATKFYEIKNPSPDTLVKTFDDGTFTAPEVIDMETEILGLLDYRLYYYSEYALASELLKTKIISEEEYGRVVYYLYSLQYFSFFSEKSPFVKLLASLYCVNEDKLFLKIRSKQLLEIKEQVDKIKCETNLLCSTVEGKALKEKFNYI